MDSSDLTNRHKNAANNICAMKSAACGSAKSANAFEFPSCKKYQTRISVKNGGLCAKRVSISETAHITAIIGAFALALAAIRRIKPK